ncbi:Formamidopyrimidine-DNA glycosylase [Mucisphaera calidilacus]|uniref:Formamidopyrimidine-DNA glycosylase n=1 Tax=Mucisphaera calidilacus TaxID=2527982 RepID=A0A518C0V9_9BACT|nr:Formamidopyrimidine-DNA glycosylase [Mucisphaera calidilacus]
MVEAVKRRGKQLALVGDHGSVVCLHLGMSGSVSAGAERDLVCGKHVHLRWLLSGGGAFQMSDPRRFGGVWVFGSEAELEAVRWGRLGVDALSVTPGKLMAGLRSSRRAVKAALLDQGVVAGVGNIYADESLYRARVHPERLACSLNRREVERLVRALGRVLAEAIDAGGSSLRDYVMLSGDAGRFQLAHRVYGRGGEACLRCGSVLEQGLVAQRTTVWCPACQPLSPEER